MYYVYVLQSELNPEMIYTGFTRDLRKRLVEHNTGKDTFTRPYKPWKIVWYAGFSSKKRAMEFEKYLKSGSGRAFLRRHLI
jgi:putative endonuclease